jgi:hypothetical protein
MESLHLKCFSAPWHIKLTDSKSHKSQAGGFLGKDLPYDLQVQSDDYFGGFLFTIEANFNSLLLADFWVYRIRNLPCHFVFLELKTSKTL